MAAWQRIGMAETYPPSLPRDLERNDFHWQVRRLHARVHRGDGARRGAMRNNLVHSGWNHVPRRAAAAGAERRRLLLLLLLPLLSVG